MGESLKLCFPHRENKSARLIFFIGQRLNGSDTNARADFPILATSPNFQSKICAKLLLDFFPKWWYNKYVIKRKERGKQNV